jgi:hypothetical protein
MKVCRLQSQKLIPGLQNRVGNAILKGGTWVGGWVLKFFHTVICRTNPVVRQVIWVVSILLCWALEASTRRKLGHCQFNAVCWLHGNHRLHNKFMRWSMLLSDLTGPIRCWHLNQKIRFCGDAKKTLWKQGNVHFFVPRNISPSVLQKQDALHNLNQTQFFTKNMCEGQRKCGGVSASASLRRQSDAKLRFSVKPIQCRLVNGHYGNIVIWRGAGHNLCFSQQCISLSNVMPKHLNSGNCAMWDKHKFKFHLCVSGFIVVVHPRYVAISTSDTCTAVTVLWF